MLLALATGAVAAHRRTAGALRLDERAQDTPVNFPVPRGVNIGLRMGV